MLLILSCFIFIICSSKTANDLYSEILNDYINNLKHKNPKIRIISTNVLGFIKDICSIQPLINSLQYDEDRNVRLEAAIALGKINDLQAVKPLISALNDESDNAYGE